MVLAMGCGSPARSTDDGGIADAQVTATPDASALWLACSPGQQRCFGNVHQTCRSAGELTTVISDDCTTHNQVCVPNLWCTACTPGSRQCTSDATGIQQCNADAQGWTVVQTCDQSMGLACRNAMCVNLCNDGEIAHTNIGCEYYGVDLDNIVESSGRSAAAQQYAIVVSNPDPVLTARVIVEQNNAPQGMPMQLSQVAMAVIPPLDLEIFDLPNRWVDCSSSPELNDGTGTCLTSRAYRVTSTFPVVAYQFKPLDNVNVFSNDASLLIPSNSVQGSYRVMGWPQQFVISTDNNINSGVNARAFVTIVGTQPNTHVTVNSRADIVQGGPLTATQPAGTPFTVTLGKFDVLNLETGSFLSDFTGSLITSDQPVSVFGGTECSDVPFWHSLSERQPACDHLEQQLFPAESAGRHYVCSRTPSRTQAVYNAGGDVAVVNEPEWFRILNAGSVAVHVTTTLPSDVTTPTSDPVEFDLNEGESYDIRAMADFDVSADGPVIVGQFQGSQNTTGIPLTLPGGDPSFIMVPPEEQWRTDYVVLTPNKYVFDFVQIVTRPEVRVFLDNTPVETYANCTHARADGCIETATHPCPAPTYITHRCQLSFPRIDNTVNPPVVADGIQNDGVHVIHSVTPPNEPPQGVMCIVSGFDRYVSYAYPGGTSLIPVQ